MGQAIGRNIETNHLDPRHRAGKFVQQVGFAAADVENAVAGPQTVMGGHRLSHRQPPAVVVIPAIAVLARTVPVIGAPLLGDGRAFGFVMGGHPADIVALRAGMQRGDEFNRGHRALFLKNRVGVGD